MGTTYGYRQLRVWEHSMRLVEEIFAITQRLPPSQQHCLISQLQRASVSIPSNIAEGHAKRTTRDYQRHLRIAAGSLAEVETQLELLVRLGFVTKDTIRETWMTSQTVAKMLTQLIKSTTMEKPKRPTPNSQLP